MALHVGVKCVATQIRQGCPVKYFLALFITLTSVVSAQTKPQSLDITLVSVQKLAIGEAYDCPSIDMKWREAHCFASTKENLVAPKHKYLVTATFDKPIKADKDGWAWDFTCRLDSRTVAKCRANRQAK